MQGAGVGRGQPGVVEAPTEPAFGGFQQAFLGNFLDRGMQWQVELVSRDIAGNQLEHHIAAILAALAHQHPVVAVLPVQGQAHRDSEVGQLQGEALIVGHRHRAPALQGLGEVQRHSDALVAQAFGSRFDEQGQGLEVAGVLSNERSRHLGSFLRRGRPRRRHQFLPRTCATVDTLWARCKGLMVPTIALATPGRSNSSSKLARTGSMPGLRQTWPLASAFFTRMPLW